MERTQLSQTVKGLRKEFGMTQEELAMKSGLGLNFVRHKAHGRGWTHKGGTALAYPAGRW